MFNLDNITKQDDNKDWLYKKLIIGPSGSGKTNYLLHSIQNDNNIIDKICLYAKDLEEPKYKLLVNTREEAGIKCRKLKISICFSNDPTAFIEHSNTMDDIYDDINDYNKKKKEKSFDSFYD